MGHDGSVPASHPCASATCCTRTEQLLQGIRPGQSSLERRAGITQYMRNVVAECFADSPSPVQLAQFGSVPLMTFLPDGDIDLSIMSADGALRESWAARLFAWLEEEQGRGAAPFKISNVQIINAEVKLLKCLVDNIVVDISYTQMGGLVALRFLEEVDRLLPAQIFKQSIILVKAWCYYESRVLGAHHGLFSTYALEVLVLYVFNLHHMHIRSPIEVLYHFLAECSSFDWDNYCLSLRGRIPLSSFPDYTVEPLPATCDPLLSAEVIADCLRRAKDHDLSSDSQQSAGPAPPATPVAVVGGEVRALLSRPPAFTVRALNIQDPLQPTNNVGRSVTRGNLHRVRRAFAHGAAVLADLLALDGDEACAAFDRFFRNVWNAQPRPSNGRQGRGPVVSPPQPHASLPAPASNAPPPAAAQQRPAAPPANGGGQFHPGGAPRALFARLGTPEVHPHAALAAGLGGGPPSQPRPQPGVATNARGQRATTPAVSQSSPSTPKANGGGGVGLPNGGMSMPGLFHDSDTVSSMLHATAHMAAVQAVSERQLTGLPGQGGETAWRPGSTAGAGDGQALAVAKALGISPQTSIESSVAAGDGGAGMPTATSDAVPPGLGADDPRAVQALERMSPALHGGAAFAPAALPAALAAQQHQLALAATLCGVDLSDPSQQAAGLALLRQLGMMPPSPPPPPPPAAAAPEAAMKRSSAGGDDFAWASAGQDVAARGAASRQWPPEVLAPPGQVDAPGVVAALPLAGLPFPFPLTAVGQAALPGVLARLQSTLLGLQTPPAASVAAADAREPDWRRPAASAPATGAAETDASRPGRMAGPTRAGADATRQERPTPTTTTVRPPGRDNAPDAPARHGSQPGLPEPPVMGPQSYLAPHPAYPGPPPWAFHGQAGGPHSAPHVLGQSARQGGSGVPSAQSRQPGAAAEPAMQHHAPGPGSAASDDRAVPAAVAGKQPPSPRSVAAPGTALADTTASAAALRPAAGTPEPAGGAVAGGTQPGAAPGVSGFSVPSPVGGGPQAVGMPPLPPHFAAWMQQGPPGAAPGMGGMLPLPGFFSHGGLVYGTQAAGQMGGTGGAAPALGPQHAQHAHHGQHYPSMGLVMMPSMMPGHLMPMPFRIDQGQGHGHHGPRSTSSAADMQMAYALPPMMGPFALAGGHLQVPFLTHFIQPGPPGAGNGAVPAANGPPPGALPPPPPAQAMVDLVAAGPGAAGVPSGQQVGGAGAPAPQASRSAPEAGAAVVGPLRHGSTRMEDGKEVIAEAGGVNSLTSAAPLPLHPNDPAGLQSLQLMVMSMMAGSPHAVDQAVTLAHPDASQSLLVPHPSPGTVPSPHMGPNASSGSSTGSWGATKAGSGGGGGGGAPAAGAPSTGQLAVPFSQPGAAPPESGSYGAPQPGRPRSAMLDRDRSGPYAIQVMPPSAALGPPRDTPAQFSIALGGPDTVPAVVGGTGMRQTLQPLPETDAQQQQQQQQQPEGGVLLPPPLPPLSTQASGEQQGPEADAPAGGARGARLRRQLSGISTGAGSDTHPSAGEPGHGGRLRPFEGPMDGSRRSGAATPEPIGPTSGAGSSDAGGSGRPGSSAGGGPSARTSGGGITRIRLAGGLLGHAEEQAAAGLIMRAALSGVTGRPGERGSSLTGVLGSGVERGPRPAGSPSVSSRVAGDASVAGAGSAGGAGVMVGGRDRPGRPDPAAASTPTPTAIATSGPRQVAVQQLRPSAGQGRPFPPSGSVGPHRLTGTDGQEPRPPSRMESGAGSCDSPAPGSSPPSPQAGGSLAAAVRGSTSGVAAAPNPAPTTRLATGARSRGGSGTSTPAVAASVSGGGGGVGSGSATPVSTTPPPPAPSAPTSRYSLATHGWQMAQMRSIVSTAAAASGEGSGSSCGGGPRGWAQVGAAAGGGERPRLQRGEAGSAGSADATAPLHPPEHKPDVAPLRSMSKAGSHHSAHVAAAAAAAAHTAEDRPGGSQPALSSGPVSERSTSGATTPPLVPRASGGGGGHSALPAAGVAAAAAAAALQGHMPRGTAAAVVAAATSASPRAASGAGAGLQQRVSVPKTGPGPPGRGLAAVEGSTEDGRGGLVVQAPRAVVAQGGRPVAPQGQSPAVVPAATFTLAEEDFPGLPHRTQAPPSHPSSKAGTPREGQGAPHHM